MRWFAALVFLCPLFLAAQDADAVKPKADAPASPPADEVVLEPAPSDDAAREQKRREERKKEREEERKKKQKKSGKGKCKV